MREHKDQDHGHEVQEPPGIHATSRRLFDTTIEQIVLCRFTGFQPDPDMACVSRIMGAHPDAQCLSIYNVAQPGDNDPSTISDMVSPIVRRSSAGDEPTFVEPLDDPDA